VKLFFIRTFNDVDHIVPIVYKLAEYGERTIWVFCLNPSFDIKNDFHLKFLREKFDNVRVEHIYYYAERNYAQISENGVNQHFLTDAMAKKLLKELDATVLVFDYLIDSAQSMADSLINAAKQLSIPTIGVPPGLPIFSEGYRPDIDFYRREVRTELDYNIVPHHIDADYRIDHGFKAERIRVLGSARFCKEWRNILYNILPTDMLPDSGNRKRLKVVYMERGADLHGKYREVIEKTIVKISHLDFVHFVIKPHTRAEKVHFKGIPDSVEIAGNINSLNLIKWADVVIGTNSSILIEALLQDKILFYPKYFHKDKMIFHDMNACWSVNNYGELEEALKKIFSGNFSKPYTKQDVDRLIETVVYGGQRDRDVLGEYIQFIQIAENKGVMRSSQR